MVAAVRESMTDLAPWMPWCHPAYGSVDGAAWIASACAVREAEVEYNFAIVDENDGYLGTCGINQVHRMNRFGNMGYWVRSSCTGRGIAPAAVSLLVAWAFENTSLNRLEVVVAVGNIRSQRVAEKAGATRDAVLKKRLVLQERSTDAVLYSFVRPDAPSGTP